MKVYPYRTATIAGVMETGGLVGIVSAGSVIKNCFHLGTVKGSYTTGGLFGVIKKNVTVLYCYNAGLTLEEGGYYDTTGLYGSMDTSQIVFDSLHWDATLAHIPKGYHGEKNYGSTTSELYKKETFAGWDFDSIWSIEEGAGYPQIIQRNTISSTIRFYPANLQGRISLQGNRLIISGTGRYLTTVINLRGQTCLLKKANELLLDDLPNGRYVAIIQDRSESVNSFQKEFFPFVLFR